MKKIILATLIMLALMATSVVAAGTGPPLLYTIHVKSMDVGLNGLTIEAKYVDKSGFDNINTQTTVGNGYVNFDLGNINAGVGDTVKITILSCKDNPACVKTLNVVYEPTDVWFDLSGETVIVETPCGQPICPQDITPYETCNSCCTEKECESIIKTQYVCSDKSIVESSDECPEQSNLIGYVIAVIVSLFVGAGAGTGIKIYNDSKGKTLLKHFHKNYTTAHLPSVVHAYQPHLKGQLNPRYSSTKNTDGKYNYIG